MCVGGGQAGLAPLGCKYPLRDVGVASGAGASCPLTCTHTVEAVTSLVVLAGVGAFSQFQLRVQVWILL